MKCSKTLNKEEIHQILHRYDFQSAAYALVICIYICGYRVERQNTITRNHLNIYVTTKSE